jgi:hypothetical protein
MVQVLMVGNRFRWNLSQNVGPGQPNKIEDVELVRFGYTCAKRNPTSQIAAKMKAELDDLRPFGAFDKDLAKVIVAHQKIVGGTQDGIVSVEKGTAANHESYNGHNRWIMSALNNVMVAEVDNIFPRIDKDLQSGPSISLKVKEILTGSRL